MRLSETMQEVSTTEDSIRSQSSSPYWKNDSDDTRSSPSSSSLQSSPTIEEQSIMEKQAGLLCFGNHRQRIQNRFHLVELTPTTIQREIIDHTFCGIIDGIGCINPRLGCILSGDESRRPLAERRENSAYVIGSEKTRHIHQSMKF